MTQETALSILKTGSNVFLTGEPGSGKTHTINRYVSHLKLHGVEPAITASTGIAATHIGGVTIHSWSGIGIKKEFSDIDFSRVSSFKGVSSRVKKAKVLIIDEVSMLDAKTLDLISAVCQAIKSSSEPFGGMQVVLVGDFFQLPPVTRQGEEPHQFAFESEAWGRAYFTTCYLTEQHRQSDSKFLNVLSAIRSGQVSREHRECLNGCLIDADSPKLNKVTKFFPHNEEVNRVNKEELQKLPGQSKAFTMTGKGKDNVVEQLKRGCLSPEDLELKKGAAVMFTKNNLSKGFANGTIGTVVGFSQDEEEGYPIVKIRGGRELTVEPMEWMVEENGEVIGRIEQLPLRLAWAMTVHKSQGITLDEAFMDLNGAFVEGQGYVALSRVRALDGLHLAGYSDKALKVDPRILEQDKVFRSSSENSESSFSKISAAELAQQQEDFIISAGGGINISPENRQDSPSGDSSAKAYSVEAIRADHKNAYRPWSDNEEKELFNHFQKGKSVKEIAELLGRKPGAIRSRLAKRGY